VEKSIFAEPEVEAIQQAIRNLDEQTEKLAVVS